MGKDADDEHVIETARRLRPLGYFGIGVVWLALTVISLALWAALPAILAATAGTLHDAPGIRDLSEDGSELTAFILSMLLVPPFFMYVLLALTAGCASLTALSFLFFGQSLNPQYANRRLSRTEYAVDTIGSPYAAFLPKALSLLPTQRSRTADVLGSLVIMAFRPGFGLVMASWVLGVAYFFTIGWALWPVHGVVFVLCLAATIALGVVGVWLLVRGGRARYAKLGEEPAGEADETDAEAEPQA